MRDTTMTNLRRVTDAIEELLRAETGLGELLTSAPPWLDQVLSGIALAVGDQKIVYLGASVDRGAETILRVGVFTDRLLVISQARAVPDARPVVTTQAQSRADLIRLELSCNPPSRNESDEWPSRFRIRAIYGSGLEVTVPSSVVDTPIKRASVEAVLDGLRDDLSA